jgi:hypothetical protein
MVKDHPEVCGVHYRLIQGVLEQADGPLRAVGLNLINAPHLCVIDVAAVSDASESEKSARIADAGSCEVGQNIIHGISRL